MHLDLDDTEASELKTALDIRLNELRNELAHTDDRNYRASVRDTLVRLENIGKRLADHVSPGK